MSIILQCNRCKAQMVPFKNPDLKVRTLTVIDAECVAYEAKSIAEIVGKNQFNIVLCQDLCWECRRKLNELVYAFIDDYEAPPRREPEPVTPVAVIAESRTRRPRGRKTQGGGK